MADEHVIVVLHQLIQSSYSGRDRPRTLSLQLEECFPLTRPNQYLRYSSCLPGAYLCHQGRVWGSSRREGSSCSGGWGRGRRRGAWPRRWPKTRRVTARSRPPPTDQTAPARCCVAAARSARLQPRQYNYVVVIIYTVFDL